MRGLSIRSRGLALSALLCLVVATPAHAVPTTLYVHLDDYKDAPLSVVPPPEEVTADGGAGLATHSTGCIPPLPGQSLTGKRWHSWRALPTTGPIEYERDAPVHVNEFGIARDVSLNGSVVLHWYLAVSALPGSEAPAAVAGARVEATIRTGGFATIAESSYDNGEIVATGKSEAHDLAPGQPNHNRVGNRDVYHFEIPLDVQKDTIGVADSFNLRVDAYIDVPGCDSAQTGIMANNVVAHSSDGHRPRVEWDVAQRVAIDEARATSGDGSFVLVVNATSPFGAIDVGNWHVTLEGPEGTLAVEALGPAADVYHCHCYPQPAPSWIFLASAGPAPAGEYRWDIQVEDRDGSGRVQATVLHTHVPESRDSPAPALALTLLALAFVLGRRRATS